MSNTSRITNLIALRQSQTGEPARDLKPTMKALDAELSPAQKATVDEAFRSANGAVDGREPKVGIEPGVKQGILPSALDAAQQELEAAVFHALVRASDRLGGHTTAWCYRFGQLVRQVQPEQDRLRLTLNPVILGPLLAELLPAEGDAKVGDPLYGTAGVRMRLDEAAGLELYLAESDPHAIVVLTGITQNILRDAKAYLDEDRTSSVLRLSETSPYALSATERTWLNDVPRVYGPVHLTSGLLRRARLFADTPWIKATPKGLTHLVLEWTGAPTQQAVLATLCHPATTIAATRYSGSHWPTSKIARFDVLGSHPPTVAPQSSREADVLLRALPPYHGGPNYLGTNESSARRIPLRSFHRPTLFDDLVALRCLRTGEPLIQAEKRVRAGLQDRALGLPTSTRSSFLDSAARRDLDLIREAALPSAHSASQRVLETALLLAARHSGSIDQRPQGGHDVFAAVSPRPHTLMMNLVDGAAPTFFRDILPPLDPEQGTGGIPGLRVGHSEGRLVLRLLNLNGALTDASVKIEGIDETQWRSIWAGLRKNADVELVDPLLERSPELSPGERRSMDFHRWDCGPVKLGSALLRRVGLFAGADMVDVWSSTPSGEIHVETDGGPLFRAVVNAFAHPILGIVRGDTVLERVDDSFARIVDASADAAPFAKPRANHKRQPALVLRRYASSRATRRHR